MFSYVCFEVPLVMFIFVTESTRNGKELERDEDREESCIVSVQDDY